MQYLERCPLSMFSSICSIERSLMQPRTFSEREKSGASIVQRSNEDESGTWTSQRKQWRGFFYSVSPPSI
jgi:hypothetical protein